MATFPTGMVSLIDRAKSEKTRHEREWSAATKMLRGDQWLYWSNRVNDYNVIRIGAQAKSASPSTRCSTSSGTSSPG